MQISISGFLIFLSILLLPNTSGAGSITLAREEFCTINLNGDIQAGDAQKLSQILENLPRTRPNESVFHPILCLHSRGGSFAEAIEIIKIFPERLRTAVLDNKECLSACALVFLAGRENEGFPTPPRPDRWMAPTARIGFHAPFIPVDAAGPRAYAAGVRSVARLLAHTVNGGNSLFPIDLLAEFLKLEPNKFFEIKKIHQALRWEIGILKIPEPRQINKCMLARACLNYIWLQEVGMSYDEDIASGEEGSDTLFDRMPLDLLYPFTESKSNEKIKMKSKFYKMIFDYRLGRRGQFKCAIDLYRSNKNGLMIDIVYGEDIGKEDLENEDKLENLEDYNGILAGVSVAYLFNPNIDIKSLSSKKLSDTKCKFTAD